MNSKYKIMVVDDDPQMLFILKTFLNEQGYEVDIFENPKEALSKIDEENYKILLTDLAMPEMSGTELIREVKKLNGFIQIIVITGYVGVEDIMLAFKYGANNCFFKPLESYEGLKNEIEAATAKLERITEVLKERLKFKND